MDRKKEKVGKVEVAASKVTAGILLIFYLYELLQDKSGLFAVASYSVFFRQHAADKIIFLPFTNNGCILIGEVFNQSE